jgi:WD40 repeat protein
MRTPLVLSILLAGCSSTPREPKPHVGPVTAVTTRQFGETRYLFSASQAGVRVGQQWVQTSLRPFAIDVTGEHLLIGGGEPAKSGQLELFDTRGQRLAERTIRDDLVYCVALHGEHPLAAIGCADGSIHLLTLPKLRTLRVLTGHSKACRALRFSADGKRLISGGRDGLVIVQDILTGAARKIADHTDGVECVWIAGEHIYSGARDRKLRVHAESLVRTYQGLRSPVVGLADASGTVVAALADGRLVRLDAVDATHETLADTGNEIFAFTSADGRCVYGTMHGVGTVSLTSEDASGK